METGGTEVCVTVAVRNGEDVTYCETVQELADALAVDPSAVSFDSPECCLCSAHFNELCAVKQTDPNAWPEYTIDITRPAEVRPVTDLTDEQIGRDWCSRNIRRPDHSPRPGLPPWRWVYDDGPVYALPHPLWEVMSVSRHETESDAYAAMGAGLRELKRRADEIAAVLEGVPT